MRDYKKLKIWLEGISLVKKVYKVCRNFPKEEIYGLTAQIKRSAISIPSNIAEDAGRNSDKDFYNFLGIANGSCCELDTQIVLAFELNFVFNEDLEK